MNHPALVPIKHMHAQIGALKLVDVDSGEEYGPPVVYIGIALCTETELTTRSLQSFN